MTVMEIKVKKLHEDAIIPFYAYEDDAGCDLFAIEDVMIKKGERVQIRTGIAMEIPRGYVALFWDKSGLSHKAGLKTLGGVIDSGYRGEFLVGLVNLGDEDYHLSKGQKVCQMILQEKTTAKFVEVEELSETDRGQGAFGSSGK
jgi:dUTP pyrophosphatase